MVQATAHRFVLWYLVYLSAIVIVTTRGRARWLQSRSWLPKRRIIAIPVMSTVTPTRRWPALEGQQGSIVGVFGFSCNPSTASVVVGALNQLNRGGHTFRLKMIGSPGPSGPRGQSWTECAREIGLPIEFTGELESGYLSAALASVDILIFPDPAGPSSRRTTLACSLGHGVPVIAFEGDETWQALRESKAVELVPRSAEELARRLAELLGQPSTRAALSRRGIQFHDREMAPAVIASSIAKELRHVTGLSRSAGQRA